MREILFRGKRIFDGKWVDGCYMTDEQDLSIAYIGHIFGVDGGGMLIHDMDIVMIDHETVCQYTGLIDQNGRKIFEGDIVRYTDEIIGKEKVDEVKYNETHAAFCRLHNGKRGLQYLFIDEIVANKCEVIGNIFDNPELILDGCEDGKGSL